MNIYLNRSAKLVWLLFLFPLLSQAVEVPETPKSNGKEIVIKKTILMTKDGETRDYHGAKLVWKGRGDCSQKEGMPPMFRIIANNVTIKNAVIVDSPDGIHVHRSNAVLENLVFPDVCEDAITMHRGAKNVKIKNCYFRDAADKAIQLNHGRGHKVENNTFVDVGQALRVKRGAQAVFRKNALYRVRVGVHADGKGARAEVGKNKFYKVRDEYVAEKKAKISGKDDDKRL